MGSRLRTYDEWRSARRNTVASYSSYDVCTAKTLCPMEKLEAVHKKMKSLVGLHVIYGCDHSNKIGKKHLQTKGSTQKEAEGLAVQAMAAFVSRSIVARKTRVKGGIKAPVHPRVKKRMLTEERNAAPVIRGSGPLSYLVRKRIRTARDMMPEARVELASRPAIVLTFWIKDSQAQGGRREGS